MDLLDFVPKEYALEAEVQDKPTCPLCLLAVQEIYDAVRNNKTEVNFKNLYNWIENFERIEKASFVLQIFIYYFFSSKALKLNWINCVRIYQIL